MRKTILFLLMFVAMAAQCASVRLYFVNPFTNERDTNAIYITPIGTNVLANGGVVHRGVTTKVVPAINGYATNTLAVGHYSITNRYLGSGVVIRVPESSALLDYTNILVSGYNTFVTIENGTGGTVQTNISYTAVTNLSSAPITDAQIASTIARDSEVTAADTVVSNGVVSGLAAGSYTVSGNGAGLTNVPASSIVKYISQTKPVNADSNWFGPWTPGTVTAGIQEAWDSVVKPTNAGPTAKGVVFQFEGGYYYFTNALVFSNYWPMAMTFRGANLLDTKLVYAGTQRATNTITFKGPSSARPSSLNLPLHLTVTDLGFTAINDTTNILVDVKHYSHANFTRCNFTSWGAMTNQIEGAGVSSDGTSYTTTNGSLVGIRFSGGQEHSTILNDIFFMGLATGIDAQNDHVTAFSLKFAHIGLYAGTWGTQSPYSLGACILRTGGLDSSWYYCHFYSAKLGFAVQDTHIETPFLDRPNFEAVTVNLASVVGKRPPIVKDPTEYSDAPEWVTIKCYAISNSPNWGVVTSQIITNFIAYGVDGPSLADDGGGAYSQWKVRIGDKDRFKVDQLGIKAYGRGEFNTAANIITSDPDLGLSIADSSFNQYNLMLPDGTFENSVSAKSPKFIVGTPTITSGSGAPSADEPKGSLYLRTDGSTSTTLYVKTATGGGGWTAK